MKLNEKQLTIIFVVLFALILLGSYFFIQTAPPPAPQEIKHAAQVAPPLSDEDKALIENMRSKKLQPLSEQDTAMISQMNSSKLKPLSPAEEAVIKKMRGN